MISLIFIKLLLIFVSSTISQQTLQWNLDITTRIVEPLIQDYSEPWTSQRIQNQIFQYKTHFGIIIKQGTTFNLTVETPSEIENLYFYFLADLPYEKLIILNLAGEKNITKTLTTNYDGVPMISASKNVPLRIIIETKNWLSLPIYNSNDVSLSTLQEYQSEFYKNVKICGFVENYYAQMLLSANDIDNLKLHNYNLCLGLEKQSHLIQNYDYSTKLRANEDKNKESFMRVMDRTTLFIRSEKCNHANNTQVSSPSILQSDNKSFNSTNNLTIQRCQETNLNRHFISGIDFGINPENLQTTGVKGDLKPDSSLILKKKMNEIYVNVTFTIESPIDLTNSCLYLNDKCHTIVGKVMNIKLLPDVYSVHLKEQIGDKTYISDKKNHKISQFMSIKVEVREIQKEILQKIENNLKYEFDALGYVDVVFLKILINYKNMTIELKQLLKTINVNFKLYFIISLERNGSTVFENELLGSPQNDEKLINLVQRFQYNDIIHIYHAEPGRLTSNYEGLNKKIQNNNFILAHKGLQTINYNLTGLNNEKYLFYALGNDDRLFLKVSINYKTRTIELHQLLNDIHRHFELYFSISLERNGSSILDYKFLGSPQNGENLIKLKEKFQINDTIHIYHVEPDRLNSNLEGFKNKAQNNKFILSNKGLQIVNYTQIELCNLKYEFDALGIFDKVFLKIYINYSTMRIELKQLIKAIHWYFKLYFIISLERNGLTVFEKEFFGSPENDEKLINLVLRFQYNDKIHIYHAEPGRLTSKFEGLNKKIQHNNFILAHKGLQTINYNGLELNNVKYLIYASGNADRMFLKVYINYKTMTLELHQLLNDIHPNFELYFSISLERNSSSIFDYKFLGSPQSGQKLIKLKEKFQINDTIHIYHVEPDRLYSSLEGFDSKVQNNSFILSSNGLQIVNYTQIEIYNLKYEFDALNMFDKVFLNIYVNYSYMRIELKQLLNTIHRYFKLYLIISLERNGSTIFEKEFFGFPENDEKLINFVQSFQYNDIIHIYHAEPARLTSKFEGLNKTIQNNYFILAHKSLQTINYNGTGLNNVKYLFYALGNADRMFLKVYINYKTMTLELHQLLNDIHPNFELYFSISLERNSSSIFDYKFLGSPQNDKKLIKLKEKFQINDTIHIYHVEPDRLYSNLEGFDSKVQNNSFILSNNGLQIVNYTQIEIYNLKYEFDALNILDKVFLNIYINYSAMRIELKQLLNTINGYFKLYFIISLERNGSTVFKYEFLGSPQNDQKLINFVQRFQYNDIIHIYHAEPGRLTSKFEGLNKTIQNNNFILAHKGLQTINYNGTGLNNVKYLIYALGNADRVFLKVYINYKTMTLELHQLLNDIHPNFELYFSISLERNSSSIFDYKFLGSPQNDENLIKLKEKFQINDTIHIYHVEPDRLYSNLERFDSNVQNNTFILSNNGLQIVNYTQIELYNLKYEFNFFGRFNHLCLQMYINYSTMRIELKQLRNNIHWLFKLYFIISLERNGSTVFENEFFGYRINDALINLAQRFQYNDIIYIYYAELGQLRSNFDGNNNKIQNNNFILAHKGLQTINYNRTGLNNVKYLFYALGNDDRLFLKVSINYKTMTLELHQLLNDIHPKFEFYFSISLERNSSSIFDFKFFGSSKYDEKLIKLKEKFQIFDIIHIYHVEPDHLNSNLEGFVSSAKNNTFILLHDGLRTLK
ncbi:uncharacterized protein LOC127287570 [Leptopilina boulardi]|uniref:uncharacterized protein LOC127287570 n=1 Tax=Leptopilina boulardi TaxID=63433 RepID=UPI0021F60A7F|nr:uncharacterized protein LOC127287570 [Leptopilina boulardi]